MGKNQLRYQLNLEDSLAERVIVYWRDIPAQVIVKVGRNRPKLVRLISSVAPGPRASDQPTFVTFCPVPVGGAPAERVA